MSSAENLKDVTDIPTITCNCGRVWPKISEQAVVYDLLGTGDCYSCFIQKVVEERDKRMEEADYKIDNCPRCTGIPGAREECTFCDGRGWVRQGDEPLIQLLG